MREGLTSLVVPAHNEAANISALLTAIGEHFQQRRETLIIYDFDDDNTLPPVRRFAARDKTIRLVHNRMGPGVLSALRTGFAEARGDVVCVVMADLSDDVSQIGEMASLVRHGATVSAASRYMAGGRQIGGPRLKKLMSRAAGVSLHLLAGLGTHDPTSNFKAYDRNFLDGVTIESTRGFEIALELTTKAHLSGCDVKEIPTTWRDRTAGESRFDLVGWLPAYLRWYWRCLWSTWTGVRRRALRAASTRGER